MEVVVDRAALTLDASALSATWDKGAIAMLYVRDLINSAGLILDAVGVLVILIGAAAATLSYLKRPGDAGASFRLYRKSLGRSILLGLEFMVGGDIVRTVSVEHPSLDNVVVLGMIVLIRTVLSWSMEVEIEGRWPWRGAEAAGDGGLGAGDAGSAPGRSE